MVLPSVWVAYALFGRSAWAWLVHIMHIVRGNTAAREAEEAGEGTVALRAAAAAGLTAQAARRGEQVGSNLIAPAIGQGRLSDKPCGSMRLGGSTWQPLAGSFPQRNWEGQRLRTLRGKC